MRLLRQCLRGCESGRAAATGEVSVLDADNERLTRWLRRCFLGYVVVMLLCVAGYVKYDLYGEDGDSISFLDMSRYLQHGQPEKLINGYWNPGYAVALAAGDWVLRPARYEELGANYKVNAVIFGLSLLAVWYLAGGLVALRRGRERPGRHFALPEMALAMFGTAMLMSMYMGELSVARVRSDGLLLLFLLAAGGFGLRLLATRRWVYAVPLGLMLAGSYYTKSFGFAASVMLLGLLAVAMMLPERVMGVLATGGRWTSLAGVGVAALIFVMAVTPYIAAISRARRRLTIGDSSRLVYVWQVDGGPSIHEAYLPHEGNSVLALKHPEEKILDQPAVYSYERHLDGTMPIWFDPSWWHDNTIPHGNLPHQLHAVLSNVKLSAKYVLGHGEPLALLLLLWVLGYRLRWERWALVYLVPIVWGAGMWATYMPILIQDRYIDGALLLMVLSVAALMEGVEGEGGGLAAGRTLPAIALVLMLGAAVPMAALRFLAVQHGLLSLRQAPGGWYDTNMQETARGLAALGVQPGDRVACAGELACHNDAYWAYLAGAQTVADVDVPSGWVPSSPGEQAAMLEALHRVGAKVLVASFGAAETLPPGWHRLGSGSFSALVVP